MTDRCFDTYNRLTDRWDHYSRRKRALVWCGIYTVLFLLLSVFVYSPFWLEARTLMKAGDARDQHFRFLMYTGRALRRVFINALHGKFGVPMFDLSLGMGSDVIGTLNPHGDTDPISLIAALIPTAQGEFAYTFIAFFRLYLAGASFLYLCGYFNKRGGVSLAGSMIYCFSGFALHAVSNHPYFVSPMIVLPLMVVGVEKVLRKERPYTFIFTVFYGGLCSYYFLYEVTILTGIYGLVRLYCMFRENGGRGLLKTVLRVAGCYVLGLGLAAVVFLPAAATFLASGRRGHFAGFQWLDAAGKYWNRFVQSIAPSGSDDTLSVAAVFLFALFGLLLSKGRKSLKLLLLAGLLLYILPAGSMMMNGFQYPSFRWLFGLVLLATYITVEMLPELMEFSGRQKVMCIVVTGCYILITLFVNVFFIKKTQSLSYVYVGAIFLAVTLAALAIMQSAGSDKPGVDLTPNGSRVDRKRIFADIRVAVIVLLIVANMATNGLYKFGNIMVGWATNSFDVGYENAYLQNVAERELEPYLLDDPQGRTDSTSYVPLSAGVWQIPTMLDYSSLMPSSVADFWTGMEQWSSTLYFKVLSTGQSTGVGTLLSEKYHLEKENNTAYVPYGYSLIETTDNGNCIYENNYALPWGYTYDSAISYEELNAMTSLQKREAMLQTVALEEPTGLKEGNVAFDEKSIPFEVTYDGCTWEDGQLKAEKNNGTITLSFSMPGGVEGYARLKGYVIRSSASVRVSCEGVSRTLTPCSATSFYYEGQEDYVLNLGYSDQERTSLTITLANRGTSQLDDIELYALPMDSYPEQVEALRAEPLENIHWGANSLTGTVDLSKDKILCVSVPYSKGWTATVDGEKAEILKGNYMFMCLPLTAGHHDIEFHYCSPGIRLGAVMTVCSAGIVIWMLVRDRKKKRGQMEAC